MQSASQMQVMTNVNDVISEGQTQWRYPEKQNFKQHLNLETKQVYIFPQNIHLQYWQCPDKRQADRQRAEAGSGQRLLRAGQSGQVPGPVTPRVSWPPDITQCPNKCFAELANWFEIREVIEKKCSTLTRNGWGENNVLILNLDYRGLICNAWSPTQLAQALWQIKVILRIYLTHLRGDLESLEDSTKKDEINACSTGSQSPAWGWALFAIVLNVIVKQFINISRTTHM